MKNLLKSAWGLVQENQQAYILLNIIYYGLVVIGMIYVAFDQELQKELMNLV